jgi:hypothetical protein
VGRVGDTKAPAPDLEHLGPRQGLALRLSQTARKGLESILERRMGRQMGPVSPEESRNPNLAPPGVRQPLALPLAPKRLRRAR